MTAPELKSLSSSEESTRFFRAIRRRRPDYKPKRSATKSEFQRHNFNGKRRGKALEKISAVKFQISMVRASGPLRRPPTAGPMPVLSSGPQAIALTK